MMTSARGNLGRAYRNVKSHARDKSPVTSSRQLRPVSNYKMAHHKVESGDEIIAQFNIGEWYRGCALVSKTKEMSSSLISPAKYN